MKKYLYIIFSIFIFSPGLALAYNNTVVHPGITGEAISLYLRNGHKGEISNEEKKLIIKGAKNEDTDPRYLNHFYNPDTKKGLFKGLPNAKKWAFVQYSASGDYSVGSILDNYRNGNEKRAFEGIGHILHLVQDMGTPAHVRLDPHPPRSADGLEIATEESARYPFIETSFRKKEIADIFDGFSKYTIDNFYSDDRIDNNIKIEEIETKKEADGTIHNYGLKTNKVVCEVQTTRKKNICILNKYVYKYYWQTLYPKTVIYSASAIEWFMDEFEKIDKEKEKMGFWDKTKSFLIDKPVNSLKSVEYVWGDTYLAGRDGIVKATKGVKYLAEGAGEAVYYSGLALEEGGEKIVSGSIDFSKKSGFEMLEGVAGASSLAGKAIEKTYKNTSDVAGKVLSSTEKAGDNIAEKLDKLTQKNASDAGQEVKVLGIEGGAEDADADSDAEKIDPEKSLAEEKSGPEKPKKENEEVLGSGNWNTHSDILLFSGGSSSDSLDKNNEDEKEPPAEDEEPKEEDDDTKETEPEQDLGRIEFSLFDIASGDEQFSASSTVGVSIDTKGLADLSYYLSEDDNSDPAWEDDVPVSYIFDSGEGQETLYLYLRDTQNEFLASSSITILSDKPYVDILDGPAYYSSSTEARFTFGSARPPETFEYSFNNDAFQSDDMSGSISEGLVFPDGQNVLDVRVSDELGRTASATYSWLIDTEAPQMEFASSTILQDGIELFWREVGLASTSEVAPLRKIILEVYVEDEFDRELVFSPDVSSALIEPEEDMSFRLMAFDMAGNEGDWTPYGPADYFAPEAVSDLDYIPETLAYYSVELSWSLPDFFSPEGGGMDLRYEKYEDECRIAENWEEAESVTLDEESIDSALVKGLDADSSYCFALKISNEYAGSGLSNILEIQTKKPPEKELTIPRTHNGYIMDKVLTKENSPYLFSWPYKVRGNGLRIEPGVVIKFKDVYHSGNYYFPNRFNATGPVTAMGTKEEPIIFTSIKDDEFAGDSNMDMNKTIPEPGSWGNIQILSEGSVFENVIIRYAGRDTGLGFLRIYEDDNIVRNSFFEHNASGIQVSHASSSNPAIISDNVFIDCGGAVSAQNGSNPIVEGSIFQY